ncbi:MAG: nicotinate phosphoribosyltransferase [Actinobacteria bacterium]|nr:MAG: nicotinate phosphoribosyltransferase [Actinomycetota bacterium]
MPGGLRTDLYELNMAVSYLRRGMTGASTFSLYIRKLPKHRGFLVAAGLQDCLDFLEEFSFDEDDLRYLGSIGFDERAQADLADIRFDGEVWAVPEGTIVHADEPILEVTAPIAVAQLVETALLNRITLHTTLASKAARYVLAAEGRDLVDFSFRRTHGMDAAMAAARSSAIVGFAATSDVVAARAYGLQVAGTMAHSFIEAFPSEELAFRSFAEDHPTRTTFLVDTYDTLNGVRTAIAVARGGLDEFEVAELVHAGAPVDAFGIGTQMGVSADAPYLDTVYKLVQYDGRPSMKLSTAKASPPGPKQIWRSGGEEGDVLGLRDDDQPAYGWEPLLEAVMRDGRRIRPDPPLRRLQHRFQDELVRLPTKARRLSHPEHVQVRHSPALAALTVRTQADALVRAGLDEPRSSD